MTTTPKTLAAEIKANLGLKARTKMSGAVILETVCRRAQYQELPQACYTAAYGITWALGTGRLPGKLHISIEKLAPSTLVALIASAACACPTIGDVPAFLIANADLLIA